MKTIKLNPEIRSRPIQINAWESGITAFNPGEFGVYVEGWPRLGMWNLVEVIRFETKRRTIAPHIESINL